MTKEIIKIRQLTPDFYNNHNLKQMLDQNNNKGRGYGILLAQIKGYIFAIPFRSYMKLEHQYCFPTIINETDGNKQGLDYTKAVIITDTSYIATRPFFLKDKKEFVLVRKNARTIVKEFEEFVDKYILAVTNNDSEFLTLREVQFSTLQNYHNELSIQEKK